MARVLGRWLAALVMICVAMTARAGEAALRPPAVPLVTHDPYFSVWSAADRLTDRNTTHWTGTEQPLRALVRIDGRAYRVMGADPADVPPLPQASLSVLPTRTIYRFASEQIALTLTFTTPLLPSDLEVLARPVTYLTWELASADGKAHSVQLYFDAGAMLAVNTPEQPFHWDHPAIEGLTTMRIGHPDQPVLQKKGDNLRIDWGYAYLSLPASQKTQTAVGAGSTLRGGFVADGKLPYLEDADQPRPASKGAFVMAAMWDAGQVGEKPAESWAMLAYDDRFAIRYFQQDLRPYWRRNGATPDQLLIMAARDRETLREKCKAFDEALLADLSAAGGEKYARLCALAYRQTMAGNKLAADAAGMPLLFPKENFSNGCIATVDVLYPQSPFYLVLSPALTRAMLVPVLDYAASPRWKFDYAPHDLGTYPHATGQVYGGGERSDENQMPVEESGNMLIMMAALARVEGNAELAQKYWPLLTKWADYLVAQGLDPANQLCTADMFGHLAHNADLSLKAIIAIGGYAQLCDQVGQKDAGAKYMKIARDYAAQWQRMAADEGRTRLAFDRPGTWGMKHNLIWDRILGLGLFPDAMGDAEIAWYLKVQNAYGLPCDGRTNTSLLDWAVWCISLAREPRDFESLLDPLYRYAHETPSRVPLSDWFITEDGKQKGFQARPVVGGIYMRLLADQARSRAWAMKAQRVPGAWAPLPLASAGRTVLPAAPQQRGDWRYTMTRPADAWSRPNFDDSAWKTGAGGFGTAATPGAVVGTTWDAPEIWLRRSFDLAEVPPGQLAMLIHHDEDVEVYLNGTRIAQRTGWTTDYVTERLGIEAADVLRPGRNVIAVRCRQTGGGQYIDVGLSAEPQAAAAAAEEGNPVLPGYFADPSLCCVDGKFYIYATTDWYGWEAGPFVAWKSDDLRNWSFRGLIHPEVSGQRNWAPSSVIKRDGKYYLYYAKQVQIHVAVADSPEGPFKDALGGKPLIAANYRPTQSIDAEVLIDDDGQAYLYWGGGPTYVVRLKKSLLELDGEPVRIRTNEKFGYVEGPFPFKRKGRYYLTGAANGYHNYHIIYGMSDSPMGPFTFPDNNPITLIDWEEGVYGPGHGSVMNLPGTDQWYVCYLRNFPRQVVSPIPRQVAIDKLEFYEDGRIKPSRLTRRGVDAVKEAPVAANLALGRVATASSSGGGLYGRRDPGAAVDGTFATRWVAGNAQGDAWWQVDLGEARDIERVEVFVEFPTKTYRYGVETSLDGKAWEPYSDHAQDEAFESPKVDRKKAKARYVRVTFTGTKPQGTPPALWEVRVY